MNHNQFYQYLENYNQLNDDSLAHLKELVSEYPYFQTARMLLLKNMHLIDHIKYQSELKLVAAHIADRKQMYLLIHNHLQPGAKIVDVQSLVETVAMPVAVAPIVSPTELSADEVDAENYFNVSDQVETPNEIVDFSSVKYNIGKVASQPESPTDEWLDFELNTISKYQLTDEAIDASKSRSFVDWLNAMNQSHIKLNNEPNSAPVHEQMNLIDSFLKNGKDKITPLEMKKEDVIDVSAASAIEKEDLMTETLANIHIKQKRYDKAILIFEKLNLKYPEKKIYFADRISNVRKLTSNQ